MQLDCNPAKTDVAKLLDVWPPLPISLKSDFISDGDGIINKLQHRDRIVRIELNNLTAIQLERCATLMQGPFPFLRSLMLYLRRKANDLPVLPNTFLAVSAPCLHFLSLKSIQFPTLLRLLLSARDLVSLYLDDVTSTRYISPDTIVTSLSMLTRLRCLQIHFLSQGSFSNPRNPSHPLQALLNHAVPPSLSVLMFWGVSKYSEDLMSWINAALLFLMFLSFYINPSSTSYNYPCACITVEYSSHRLRWSMYTLMITSFTSAFYH